MELPQRKSLRLRGYDYSQNGLYFITICTQNRFCFFGNINDGNMILNESGQMIQYWLQQIPSKFPDIYLHEYIVMPNHIHFIVEKIAIMENMDDCNVDVTDIHVADAHAGAPLRGHPQYDNPHGGYGIHNIQTNKTIGAICNWLKTMTTNNYIRGVKQKNWVPFHNKLWHRNYYDIIIRNEESFFRIATYIRNNPKKWDIDSLK